MKNLQLKVLALLLILGQFSGTIQVQQTRTEKDLLGEKRIPADAYYGVQTLRHWKICGALPLEGP